MLSEIETLKKELNKLKCQKKVLSSTEITEGDTVKGCYLLGFNPEDGTLFYRNDENQWEHFEFGAVGTTQDLDSVLNEGNTSDQSILLTGAGTQFSISSDIDDASTSIAPGLVSVQNTDGFTAQIENDLAVSNTNIHLPASSGTLALLSDIPLGGPLTVNTQTSDYTLQLSDGDNNTLVEMDSATDNVVTLDGSTLYDIGTSIMIGSKGGGITSIVATGSAVILTPGNVASEISIENGGAVLTKISATEWLLWGDVGDPVPGLENVIESDNSLTADQTVALGTHALSFDNGVVNINTNITEVGRVFNVVGDARHAGDVLFDDTGTLNGNSYSINFKGQTTAGNYQNGRIYYDSNTSGGALILYNDQSNSTAALFNFGLQLSSGRVDTVNTSGLQLSCSSLTNGIHAYNGYNQSSGYLFRVTNNLSGGAVTHLYLTYDGYLSLPKLSTSLSAPSTTGTVKMVITDGNGKLSWQNIPGGGGGDALTTNPLSQFASTTSAQLAGVISDETGTGTLVFNTNPVFGTKITSPLVLGGTSTTQTLTFQTTSGNATTGADFLWLGGNNGATTLATLSAAGALTLNNGGGFSTTGTCSFGTIVSTGSLIRASASGWYDWGSSNTRLYSPANGTLQVTNNTGTAQTGIVSTGGLITNYVAKTGAYTLTGNDYAVNCTSGTFNITLPTAVGRAGQDYIIKNSGAGTITINTTSAQTIDGASTVALSVQYSGKRLMSDGANWIIVGSF